MEDSGRSASIHAPARGATQRTRVLSLLDCRLQSTLPHGERRPLGPGRTSPAALQSTLPHGERHIWLYKSTAPWVLQSTLPHGERHPRLKQAARPEQLQSTLPHGERLLVELAILDHAEASIHAPARGATPIYSS